MKQKTYELLPIVRQKVLTFLAMVMVSITPDQEYYSVLAMQEIWNDVPEIEKQVQKEFPDAYKYLVKYKRILANIKSYYDGLEDGTIVKDDITSARFRKYKDAMLDWQGIDQDVGKMFVFTIKKTSIIDWSTPSEYIARADRKYKSFEPKEEQRQKTYDDEEKYED